MELIYALMIFFGYMTPTQYTEQTSNTFKTGAMMQTLNDNPVILEEAKEATSLGRHIRAIDRTED